MVRKTNRKGVRRQSAQQRAQQASEKVAAPGPDATPTGSTPSNGVRDKEHRAPDVAASPQRSATNSRSPAEGKKAHKDYLYMRAVGRRAGVIINEVRIMLGTRIEDLKNVSTVDVLEVKGIKLLKRVDVPIQRYIQRFNLNRSDSDRVMGNSLMAVLEAKSKRDLQNAGLPTDGPKVSGEREGLYFRCFGQGKVVSNFYRLICRLPSTDVSDPAPDELEITGFRFDSLDLILKTYAMSLTMGTPF